jgi:hypothetical protein
VEGVGMNLATCRSTIINRYMEREREREEREREREREK